MADLSDRLAARKVVDRAKGILQDRFGWDEPTAFAWLQRTAMDRRLPMVEVARTVLETGTDHSAQ